MPGYKPFFGAVPDEEPKPQFTLLNSERVVATVSSLRARISERFPESGLLQVCLELEKVCQRSRVRIEWIGKPIWTLRILRYSLIVLIVLGLFVSITGLLKEGLSEDLGFVDWVQTLEAGINDIVLISLAVFFVWNLEARVKRRRAMRALHELRSIAHVIDMHQLTKDPDRIMRKWIKTSSSPQIEMSSFDLRRYLDYCSEMLSLVSKVAALHLQSLEDGTVVAAVNEIEELTTGLSRKIWQKIDILRATE